jgi:hypothetical protein
MAICCSARFEVCTNSKNVIERFRNLPARIVLRSWLALSTSSVHGLPLALQHVQKFKTYVPSRGELSTECISNASTLRPL